MEKTIEDVLTQVREYFKLDAKDTGSTPYQICKATYKIINISGHLEGKGGNFFKSNRKDNSAKYGLQLLVVKRKRLLTYLKKNNSDGYYFIINLLGIRDIIKS